MTFQAAFSVGVCYCSFTHPSNFLLEKEKVNLLSLFPDKGVFSDLCSSSIFRSESGLLFWKAKDPKQKNKLVKWVVGISHSCRGNLGEDIQSKTSPPRCQCRPLKPVQAEEKI